MANKYISTGLNCPLPIDDYPYVLMAHGGGGKLMRDLIQKLIAPAFDNEILQQLGDGAVFDMKQSKIAFTTDSYVVQPLFFPGGDIGSLAVNGTVNDLAMCGAKPLYLSCGFILEEGFSMQTLWQIAQSMKSAADAAEVQLVTGDTKVVDKGKGDGIYINTAGVGIIEHELNISPLSIQPGDVALINGDIGRHGIAVMASRQGLEFETTIKSDCAPLGNMVNELLENGLEIHCMRDLTRGGLATALVEIAETAGMDITLEEDNIPVRSEVAAACEILGFDPLYIANEGRFICILPQDEADKALSIMKNHILGKGAAIIGEVQRKGEGSVVLKNKIGSSRIIDMLSGEQLPRIC